MDKKPQTTAPAPVAGRNDNAANATADALQRWITPPRGRDACPYTGLRHASFYNAFCNNARIRQARMGTGRQRGTRLLWLPDVFAEVNRRAMSQVEGGEG
jgi:hypothetical protein